MQIKGLVKNSLLDFPGKLAAVLFTAGCNFRCPFCQNAQLVLRPQELPDIPPQEVLSFLAARRGFLDGVVLSGGEPTLQADLPDFMRQVKKLGLAVKLDTNGYRPDVLREVLADGAVDMIALDIKAARQNYTLAAGIPPDFRLIEQSIALLLSSSVAYELRTTVVPGIVKPEDVDDLAALVHEAKRYVLQQFRPQEVLDPAWRTVAPYSGQILSTMVEQLHARGIATELRGV